MEILGQEKLILDATAGNRMMWFNKQHPDTLYIDQRPEVQPDQVADFRELSYPDNSFALVVFDPPHIIDGSSVNNRTGMLSDFGALQKETWQSDLKRGFKELFRVLKPNGFLIFKWSNQQISSDRLISLAPFQPLFYQVTSNKRREKAHSDYQTLWFCFMKPASLHAQKSSNEVT